MTCAAGWYGAGSVGGLVAALSVGLCAYLFFGGMLGIAAWARAGGWAALIGPAEDLPQDGWKELPPAERRR